MKNGEVEHDPLLNELIGQYVKTRDVLRKCKEGYEEFIKPHQELMNKLQGDLLSFLDGNGVESVRTKQGTACVRTDTTAPLDDPDAFIEFVVVNEAFELLKRAANPAACREYVKEHGELPPGVHLTSTRTVSVRAPT